MKTPKRTIIVDHLKCGPLKTVGFFRKRLIQDYETMGGIVRETIPQDKNKSPKYEIIYPFGKKEEVNVIIE